MRTRVVFLLLACGSVSAHAQTPGRTPTPTTRPRVVATTPAPPAPTPPPTVPSGSAPQQSVQPPARPSGTPLVVPPQPPFGAAGGPVTSPLPVPVVVFAPLQPARPLAPGKLRAHIDEAQRALKTQVQPTALGPALNFVTLAAYDADANKVHLLTMPKQVFLTPSMETTLTSSLGTLLRVRIMRPNYVNTAVVVFDQRGRQLTPLVVEYPIEKFGRFREMAYYTSAHPALLTPELVKTGQNYVHTMINLAARRLKDKGITITPLMQDVAERLCLVEHVDHDRFRRESRLQLYEEIYTLYALNELDTYRYSVSTAGAGGMVQMIPWTYQMIRQRHPGVGLNPDFVLGMRNHGNALEAMLLYMQDTWSDLALDPDVSAALSSGAATQPELMAAGYNSNPARLAGYIRRGGSGWRTLIPRETQMYLQIYKSAEGLLKFKNRADAAARAHAAADPPTP